MKKILIIMMVLMTIFSLAACGEEADHPAVETTTIGTQVPDPAETQTPEVQGPQLMPPAAHLAEGTLYIRPSMAQGENTSIPVFDTTDVTYEIYNLDTGELVCTRSRSEFKLVNSESLMLNEIIEGSIKISITEVTDASSCRIGIKAVADGYMDSLMMGLAYYSAAEMEPICAKIDENGILHIGNYNETSQYVVYIGDTLMNVPIESDSLDVFEFFHAPWCPMKPGEDGCELRIYEVLLGGDLFETADALAGVGFIGRTYGENTETIMYDPALIQRDASQLDFGEPGT